MAPLGCHDSLMHPCTAVSGVLRLCYNMAFCDVAIAIVGLASPSEMSSPGKYARKTGAEVGSELSLALLTTIREAVAYRTSFSPPMNVGPFYRSQLLCSHRVLLPCVL